MTNKTLFKINGFTGFEYYLVNINLKTLITCSSTNDLAFKGAQDGLEEGTSFLSYSQTKGGVEMIINGLLKGIYFYLQS